MQQRTYLGISESMVAIKAMQQAAHDQAGRAVALVVVDHHGDMIAFSCEAGANPALARQNAFKKAYTSACMRQHGLDFAKRLENAGMEVADFGNANFTSGGGGMVVAQSDGLILGGIGVSGRADHEDQAIAEIGLAALKDAGRIE
ncbi:MAG: GlcG/HbpS family heme-binding protein [Chloroflexota bacterium]